MYYTDHNEEDLAFCIFRVFYGIGLSNKCEIAPFVYLTSEN